MSNWLPTAVMQPGNLEARGAMLAGSCLVGISFLKGLGLVHSISHMVGAEYDKHHGLTNAVVLPVVLRFNADVIEARVRPIADAMGLEDTSFDVFYTTICEMLDRLEIPNSLVDIGVLVDCAATIAFRAIQDCDAVANPREATVQEIQSAIESASSQGQ